MIIKYLKAAIVILIGGAAYFFVLGKSTERPVSKDHIDSLFDTYEEKAMSSDLESYPVINDLTEMYMQIDWTIDQIKNDQTMYNRFFSKAHYYDDLELAAIEERFEEIATTHSNAIEEYLAPRINFNRVLSGEIHDPAIVIDIDGNDFKIEIEGRMQQSSHLAAWWMYYINTPNGMYFLEEPDFSSATMSDTYFEFRGDTNYVFHIRSSAE